MDTPTHYKTSPDAITPWDLQKHMQSSGNAFVDARRADAIEYAFRLKGDLLEDLKKARHCLDEAIGEMEGKRDAGLREEAEKAKAGFEAGTAFFKKAIGDLKEEKIEWHNPDGLSEATVGKVWRLLIKGSEVTPKDAELWINDYFKWLPVPQTGHSPLKLGTYRTKAPLPTK